MSNTINGVINVYKEKGYTSHDVVAIIRKMLGRKVKVGHTGTLDPDAEGVLPICIGRGTKLSNKIMNGNKEYIATFELGITTNTLDITGEVITKKDDFEIQPSEIEKVIKTFIGKNKQIPPMYSAIKVNGKKLYELAREGKEIERKSREVTIHNIDIIEINNKIVTIKVNCSKGTYIRTLCADIGNCLEVGATMTNLIRTETGSFNLDNAIKVDELKKLYEDNKINDVILTLDLILKEYQRAKVSKEANKYLYNGNKLSKNYINKYFDNSDKFDFNKEIVLYDYEDNIIGIYKLDKDEKLLVPEIFLMNR